MKDILKYRMIILDRDANIHEYFLHNSGMHQDCLDDFAKNCGYEYSNSVYLVQEGNGCFIMLVIKWLFVICQLI